MYATTNFKTKAALKNAVKEGQRVTVYQPNDMFGNPKASPTYSGSASVEGPHFPQPHKWYATVTIKEGVVVAVK